MTKTVEMSLNMSLITKVKGWYLLLPIKIWHSHVFGILKTKQIPATIRCL